MASGSDSMGQIYYQQINLSPFCLELRPLQFCRFVMERSLTNLHQAIGFHKLNKDKVSWV